jgi:hypothetical protein
MRRVALTPGVEKSATGVSLTALTERVHCDGAIPPRRNHFLLIYFGLNMGHSSLTWAKATAFINI